MIISVISLAMIGLGTVGLAVAFSSGVGAAFGFFLFYFAFAAISAWVMTFMARRQLDLLVGAPPQVVVEAIRKNFSGIGWKTVDGPGELNFQARGFGMGSYGKKRPVMSIHIEDQHDGTSGVSVWTSSWNSQLGMMALCDRVVEKRFLLQRALATLSAGAPGLASPGMHPGLSAPPAPFTAPPPPPPWQPAPAPGQSAIGHSMNSAATRFGHASAPARPAGGRKAAADDPDVTLPDPRRAENDLTQMGYELFKSCGLTLLSWGSLGLEDHSRLLFGQVPVFTTTRVNVVGSGTLGGRQDGMWLGYEGPHGSVISYHAFPDADGDFLFDNVTNLLPGIPDPLNWGIGTLHASVPAGVAAILASGRAVPLWELSAFADQRPADQLDVPPDLRAGLLAYGWDTVGDNGFKMDAALDRGGTQAVFFAPYNSESFTLMVPLDNCVDGTIPAALRHRSFAPYELDVFADMVVLCQRYPANEHLPSPEALSAAGRTLVNYADRQFINSGPAASAPAPVIQAYAPTAQAYTDAPPRDSAWTASAPPSFGAQPTSGRSLPRHRILLAAGVVAVIIALVTIALTLSRGGPSPSVTGSGGSSGGRVPVSEVTPCSTPPTLQAQSTDIGPDGLTVSARISSSCSSGDLLSNNSFRVAAVDSNGRDVASGIFDLSQTPIAVGSDGSSIQFTFPAGTYWRTPEAISGQVELTAHEDGSDRSVSANTVSASTLQATTAGAPESGNLDAAAQSALVDIAATDRAYIDSNLLNVWQPQLSSKRPGLVADGISWTAPEIVREHMQLRQRFPGARLVWTGDWPVYGDGSWWVTVAGVPFGSGEQANGWCASQGFDADHCFAKILSHNMGSSGTTLSRK